MLLYKKLYIIGEDREIKGDLIVGKRIIFRLYHNYYSGDFKCSFCLFHDKCTRIYVKDRGKYNTLLYLCSIKIKGTYYVPKEEIISLF